MPEFDISRTDRDLGAMLSGEDVERLREAINWVRKHRGMHLTDIARGCDSPEHTVRNFAYRKSNRPDNAFLGKLCKFFLENKGVLPADLVPGTHVGRSESHRDPLGRLALYEHIRLELPISEGDLLRVFDRYSGYYLCFRRSYRSARMSVSWLHLRPLNPNLDVSRDSLPLPRFTLFIKYQDRFDPEVMRSYIIMGYAMSRNGRLFLVGHHDGELQYITLNEPTGRKFTYLQGLCLLTSANDKQPFSTRLMCQYLGPDASRTEWENRIGVFADADFGETFDNADVVMRAIGGDDVLIGSLPE